MAKKSFKNSCIDLVIRIATAESYQPVLVAHSTPPKKISSKFVHNFLSCPADRQRSKQTIAKT